MTVIETRLISADSTYQFDNDVWDFITEHQQHRRSVEIQPLVVTHAGTRLNFATIAIARQK